jgi:hypothetical protein
MPWGENWGGGCKAMIVVDNKTAYTGVMDNHGTDYLINIKVQIGSRIDFLIVLIRRLGSRRLRQSFEAKKSSKNKNRMHRIRQLLRF